MANTVEMTLDVFWSICMLFELGKEVNESKKYQFQKKSKKDAECYLKLEQRRDRKDGLISKKMDFWEKNCKGIFFFGVNNTFHSSFIFVFSFLLIFSSMGAWMLYTNICSSFKSYFLPCCDCHENLHALHLNWVPLLKLCIQIRVVINHIYYFTFYYLRVRRLFFHAILVWKPRTQLLEKQSFNPPLTR